MTSDQEAQNMITLNTLAGMLPTNTPGTMSATEASLAARAEARTAAHHRKQTSKFIRMHMLEVAVLHADAAVSAADRAEHHILSADPAYTRKVRKALAHAKSARKEAAAAHSALGAYAASRPSQPGQVTVMQPELTGVLVKQDEVEPDRSFHYLDTEGRIWHFEDVSWFAGWHLSGIPELFTWEHAQKQFLVAFPLAQVRTSRHQTAP